MTNYTTLDKTQIQACLNQVHLGELLSFTAASHGIENSNYLLVVAQDEQNIECVLTVYEGLPKCQVEIYTTCLQLWGKHLPVPRPLHAEPEAVPAYPDKVFVVATRLPGEHIMRPEISHCEQMGAFLARFHLTAQKTPRSFTGPRSIPWVLAYEPAAPTCVAADISQFKSYQDKVRDITEALATCPKGWVHGDLFPDNALFTDGQLSGVIDFNNACTDVLLLDLCITLNAWSSLGVETSCPARFEAMLKAYTAIRPLTDLEQSLFDKTLLVSALRFWASRIDFLRDTGGKPGKEPQEYQRIAASYAAKL